MKISIYGAGNQKFYIEELKLQEKLGGEPPFGGGAMAIEFARAGHDVVLSEPNRDVMDEELWRKIEEAGVKVVRDDTEAAKHGEIHLITRTFSENTIKSIKNILQHIPKDSVIAICDSTPVIMIYSNVERELRFMRKDVGLVSMCPNAIPGTGMYSRYVIGHKSLDGEEYSTEEQFNRCVDLVKSINREVVIKPIDLVPLITGLSTHITTVTLSGILNYYRMKSLMTEDGEKISEREVLYVLQTISAILETSSIRGLIKALDVDLLIENAKASKLLDEQEDLEAAIHVLSNLSKEFSREVEKCEVKPISVVASQALVEEIRRTVGGAAADGVINRCKKKFLT
ncbi:MAG TPA: H(2)-dependent methylenetetrahydromethanopterin dehydrogenase-related protein [Methanothermococcus okinawensis]|uniref:H(2)-dependent methylenetetrahydromethanopterin dehydrogenase-related protein n=1 Tax=Methanothermococcus okinawensis TaxID=155863 RepID=A0A832ZB78_9EURY|nr:H(2)-dependent methylenetetrahydromethanopterin dehydrogenase-related protein [Methanothermococcus okinawensis]